MLCREFLAVTPPFRLVRFGWSLSLSCILSFSCFSAYFCFVGFFPLFICLRLPDQSLYLVCLTFIAKGDLADIHLFLSHTHRANLCFWQRGLASDIYSCRFLRERCVTKIANDAWYIFIRTPIHEGSGRRCTFPPQKKKSFCKTKWMVSENKNEINNLTCHRRLLVGLPDRNAISVPFPSLLNNDRPWISPPALTHIH